MKLHAVFWSHPNSVFSLSNVVVTPEFEADEPKESVFDSRDDFLTATRKLQALSLKAAKPKPARRRVRNEDSAEDEDD